jgi:cytochrome c-type biogenesis protein CcmH/NrfF
MPELGANLLLAHSGHWALWVLYSAPVVAVVIALVISSIRVRRLVEEGESEGDSRDGPPGPGPEPRA